MNIREFYEFVGGNYEDVLKRMVKEERVVKFVRMFERDPSYQGLVTAMDARVECGIDYVHPIRFGVVQLGVDIRNTRVLKPIGIALQIRTLITVLGDVNPVVTERKRL